MTGARATGSSVVVHPLTSDLWPDLLELFGKGGPYEGCWCMYWRQPGREQWANAGRGNRERLRSIVADHPPGLLAYRDGRPVGWCSVSPREEFGRVLRSPVLKPVDERPEIWSVVCFYVPKGQRRRGVGHVLLDAAVRYAIDHGARVVEGYPVDPSDRRVESTSAYTGLVRMFREAGFEEVARRRKNRPIMRYRADSAAPTNERTERGRAR